MELSALPEVVFQLLLDPLILAKVIPGCHALEQIGDNRYRADVTLGVGMVRARFTAEIGLSELNPPHSLRLSAFGLSPLGTASGTGLIVLERAGSGTRLNYDYAAEVSGKVAAVGARMLEGASKIVLRQLFEQLGRHVEGHAAAQEAWWRSLLRRIGLRP